MSYFAKRYSYVLFLFIAINIFDQYRYSHGGFDIFLGYALYGIIIYFIYEFLNKGLSNFYNATLTKSIKKLKELQENTEETETLAWLIKNELIRTNKDLTVYIIFSVDLLRVLLGIDIIQIATFFGEEGENFNGMPNPWN